MTSAGIPRGTDAESSLRCHVCGRNAASLIAGFERLRRVTSDCKPWPAGGKLAQCTACGCLQKVTDEVWHRESAAIYAAYEIYHQSDGVEQAVFDATSGGAITRSERLIEQLLTATPLPGEGRLLDVGCGNGAFLRALSRLRPGWTMVGTEVSDKYHAVVESIERVEQLHVGDVASVPGRFDLVSMIHVLEHVVEPGHLLAQIRERLTPEGLLFVEVPSHQENPFDLAIADHATHFSIGSLEGFVKAAGFEVVAKSTSWVTKELSIVARPSSQEPTSSALPKVDRRVSPIQILEWLEATVHAAKSMRAAAQPGTFALFGTSIAGTWLAEELDRDVAFFVDEDPSRAGRRFIGKDIVAPREIADGSTVFVGLPPALARSIAERLRRPGVEFLVPPPMTSAEIPAERTR